jgi:hypothetical protein
MRRTSKCIGLDLNKILPLMYQKKLAQKSNPYNKKIQAHKFHHSQQEKVLRQVTKQVPCLGAWWVAGMLLNGSMGTSCAYL